MPYLALGAVLASIYIIGSGYIWVSDRGVIDENPSTTLMVKSFAMGLTLIAAALMPARTTRWLARPGFVLVCGAVSACGALLVVASGPSYLVSVIGAWPSAIAGWAGDCLFGAGLAFVALRCGQLIGALPPRRAVVYCALAQCFVAVLFFAMVSLPSWRPLSGSPSFSSMAFFVLTPLAAGFLAYLSRYQAPPSAEREEETEAPALPRRFPAFVVVIFVFSCIMTAVYSTTVTSLPVDMSLDRPRVFMAVRFFVGLTLAAIAVGSDENRLDFSKIYSGVMVVSVAITVLLPLIPLPGMGYSLLVSAAGMLFELFLWCALAFIAFQSRVSPVVVFGFGYGAFTLAGGVGWLVGWGLRTWMFAAVGATVVFIVMALVVLFCAFVLLSERDFDKLFAPASEEAPGIEELLQQEMGSAGEEGSVRKGRFSVAVEAIAQEAGLSAREVDILRLVAMGYDSATIADKLILSWNTVRTYRRSVYAKLDVHSKQELIELVDASVRQK